MLAYLEFYASLSAEAVGSEECHHLGTRRDLLRRSISTQTQQLARHCAKGKILAHLWMNKEQRWVERRLNQQQSFSSVRGTLPTNKQL